MIPLIHFYASLNFYITVFAYNDDYTFDVYCLSKTTDLCILLKDGHYTYLTDSMIDI